MKTQKRIYRKGLLHHRYKFKLKQNIKVWFCRTFGHRIDNSPSSGSCERCGLCYEEIYHNIGDGYFMESGIMDKSLYNKKGGYKYCINIDGEAYPLNKKVYYYVKELQKIEG